jgi:DNA recombination-mediator protein A
MASRYAPLSDEAKARTLSNRARIATLVGVDRSTVTKWRTGRTHPSYDHVVAMLGLAAFDGLSLEDFGYTERPDGRVARLLAEGHAQLARDVWGDGGALVSSYPDGTPPDPARFVERDGLQAALSLAVVLVEAGGGSGSFHAVRDARELGRPVFALSSNAAGFRIGGLERAVTEFGAVAVSSTGALRRHLASLIDQKGPKP